MPKVCIFIALNSFVDGQSLAFGSLVSTSNTFESNEQVTIETTGPLIWSMSVKER